MWGLRTWWVDAVGTTRLSLYISPVALVLGAAGGVLAAFVSIALTLRSLAPASPRSLLSGVLSEGAPAQVASGQSRRLVASVGLGILGVGAGPDPVVGSRGRDSRVLWGRAAAARQPPHRRLGLAPRSTAASRERSVVGDPVGLSKRHFSPGAERVLCIALIASAAFIIVAVDAFHREGGEGDLDPRSGTGGFTLLADTLLPIAHDPSTAAGRDALNVIDFYAPGGALEDVTLTRFRLRPGEDAKLPEPVSGERP